MKDFRTYVYCCWINKCTLSGYICLLILIVVFSAFSFFEMYISKDILNAILRILFCIAILFLTLSRFGIETFRYYNDFSEIVKRGKRPPRPVFIMYCSRVAYNAVIKKYNPTKTS